MGTRAWNVDGDVSRYNTIPFAAARKAFLYYQGAIVSLAKIVLNGITFDIKKQAAEGLVTISEGYSDMTFFLPGNREPMTTEQGESMNIKSYFEMLGTTDYADVTAWNYFVNYISTFASGMDDPTIMFHYRIILYSDSTIYEEGDMPFNELTTFKDMAKRISETMSYNNDIPLSRWMEEDGTIMFQLAITLDQELSFLMHVGRK